MIAAIDIVTIALNSVLWRNGFCSELAGLAPLAGLAVLAGFDPEDFVGWGAVPNNLLNNALGCFICVIDVSLICVFEFLDSLCEFLYRLIMGRARGAVVKYGRKVDRFY